ncbi:hypothetical protein PFAG_05731 [Plasmodium falciparum Santa Lucia]|uniref:Uncharacterized protein n=10 Tax=Plasmodium falciparum TaxID=5833 RepID=C6S3J9_PLAF7|nr:conserved Plasmodium protein, unknown function [Plasmodium falciparum 3D7]ETW15826.1 hypothetical protein PFFVO_05277 [Plasmodium falciparum Vietnam Oak-Knoll (FVO)]ETW33654.1 hypothetical protein PFTANZ_05621 [Plasmodium falciparum Tanzania (2000708)]ETW39607.1 hypothetical protein PFNF135_05637 [Plasmodium falciparum NF135/5.C10]ETW46569.1 hypothetical protein PFMALIP_05472 [Plasmodium falciparum MaliPS096_E11]ETW54299.1 hypothetical protein PFUGPA_04168 [Plasmodium falciparum Palo Alto/U|eukprot:XP_002585475.1 conserved Plasmodium protein, unknown function [Plasmodium falciparum 3D7]
MIIKKSNKTWKHILGMAMLIIPTFYFKNLIFDNFFNLKFDKFKKKIYSKNSTPNYNLTNNNNNIEDFNNYTSLINYH